MANYDVLQTGVANRAVNNTIQTRRSLTQSKIDKRNAENDRTIERIQQDYDYAMTMLDIESEANLINFVSGMVNTVASVGSQIFGMVQEDQTQSLNAQNATALGELQRKINQSITDGSSTFVENSETGELEFQLAPEIEEMYNSYIQSIEDMPLISSVKKNAITSYKMNFESLKTSAFNTALDQTYQRIESNFSANMQHNAASDVQLWAQYDGKLPEGTVLSGVSTILARSDWDEKTKDDKIAAYLMDVEKQAVTERGVMLATGSGGLEAAYDYIYSSPLLFSEEKNSAYSNAVRAVNNRISSIEGLASDAMEAAFSEGNPDISGVYSLINDMTANENPQIRQAAYTEARSKQTELVTNMFNQQLLVDTDGGIGELQTTYDQLMNGDYNSYFVEIPELKNTVVAQYQSKIASTEKSLARALASTQSDIEAADKDLLSTYEKGVKYLESQWDAGQMSGRDVMSAIGALGAEVSSQLQTPDSQTSFFTSQFEALNQFADDSLPSVYQQPFDDAMDIFYVRLGLGTSAGSNAGLTPEALEDKKEYTSYATGLIADMIYEAKDGKVSSEDIINTINTLSEASVYNDLSRKEKKIYEGTLVGDPGDTNYKASVKDAIAAINAFDNIDAMSVVAYIDDAEADMQNTLGNPTTPRLKFFSPGIEKTYNNAAQILVNQISAFSGVDAENITYFPQQFENGRVRLNPAFYVYREGKQPEVYRVENEKIQITTGDGWKDVADVEYSSKGLETLRNEGISYRAVNPVRDLPDYYRQHDPEPVIAPPKEEKAPEYKGLTFNEQLGLWEADASVFDDITNEEDTIRRMNDILDVHDYGTPHMMHQLQELIKERF